MKEDKVDVLIIGAGIAGLSVTIKLATQFPHHRFALISKDHPGESNSRYAQGGIAAVTDRLNDSFEQHIQDTLTAGDGLCDRAVVEMVIRDAPERINELIAWGVLFDAEKPGQLSLGLEGGHSASRVAHVRDKTGHAIVTALLSRVSTLGNVQLYWNALALDLIIDKSTGQSNCHGALCLVGKESENLQIIKASFTILATGGIGQVYPVTTNPPIATGDGIAMAHRAGAHISNMAFVQFHPTALNVPTKGVAFLISEALRGFGAHLITEEGDRFMHHYDVRSELAPRDIVSRAIEEISQHHQVYLDCRHINEDALKKNFPAIYQTCLHCGIDIARDKIPVAPAAHYLCGGITVDQHARTSINRLFAVGETACTGLHGANRLASNSLLEAVAFAHRCYLYIREVLPETSELQGMYYPSMPGSEQVSGQCLLDLRQSIQACMKKNVGIVRTSKTMREGLNEMERLCFRIEQMIQRTQPTRDLYETFNLSITGRLILQDALAQNENRGTHFNRDKVKARRVSIL